MKILLKFVQGGIKENRGLVLKGKTGGWCLVMVKLFFKVVRKVKICVKFN